MSNASISVSQELKDIANRLRIWTIKATCACKSGHPTSCCSIAEIMAVLFFGTMRYRVSIPLDPSSDRFVLSKGHAAPILYAAWAEAGLFPRQSLLNLRKVDSDLEAYPTPRLGFVDVATGSLGQGLSVAAGMAYTGASFTRAFDQLRMAAISRANIKCIGWDAGVSDDDPLQWSLEDMTMFRAIPNSVVFYPSDAVSCERACELAANYKGISFIRTSRSCARAIYGNEETFKVGEAKVIMRDRHDKVLVITAGVTVPEAMKASVIMKEEQVYVRVMDIFTVKPLDVHGIFTHGKMCGRRIVVVEEHCSQGGLGEAVCEAVARQRNFIVKHLCVRDVPRRGLGDASTDMARITSEQIVKAIREIQYM